MGMLSPHISEKEFGCHHCQARSLKPELTYSIPFPEATKELFNIFEMARNALGPIKITSGYRCFPYQLELITRGRKAALLSPHIFAVALDLIPVEVEVKELVNFLEDKAPGVRLGVKKYNYVWAHIDVAFLIIDKLPASWLTAELKRFWKPGVRW